MKTNHGERLLVTGGAGFIGGHVVDHLVGLGYRVTVIDDLSTGRRDRVNPQAELIVGNVVDKRLVRGAIGRADACIHLAAIASVQRSRDDLLGSHRTNQSAFVGLLEAIARRRGGVIPIVYASSAAVYGAPATFPIAEDDPAHPLSAYGADKLGCELHAGAAGVVSRTPSFGLRFFNVYGPMQRPDSPYSGVISIFADRLSRRESLTIYGDGRQSRDFVHVGDVVRAVVASLEHASPAAPVCNVGTGVETSIVELAAILCRILGTEADFRFAPAREGDIRRSVADLSRAREIFGHTPQTAIYDGLRDLLKGGDGPVSATAGQAPQGS